MIQLNSIEFNGLRSISYLEGFVWVTNLILFM